MHLLFFPLSLRFVKVMADFFLKRLFFYYFDSIKYEIIGF